MLNKTIGIQGLRPVQTFLKNNLNKRLKPIAT